MFQTKEAPTLWNIISLYPDKTEAEIVEIVACFFNSISQEYTPIPDPYTPEIDGTPDILQEYEVAARLKSFRKPKSQVYGDINPILVTDFADLLAQPLTFIFNQTLKTLSWPSIWKSETVSVIPKNSAPSDISELRNLSCTPLYSKVLESFVLERLKKQVKLSPKQYGGIKGSSTEHLLIDTWNNVLSSLEEREVAANLISVDFSKAFNRMDHQKCIEALAELGADEQAIKWVSAFLYNHTMSVKIGENLSHPRTVPGGSPQGSILGNFLFCATTDCFTKLQGERANEVDNGNQGRSLASDDEETMDNYLREIDLHVRQSPQYALTVAEENQRSESELESSTEEFDFFRHRQAMPFDSSESENDTDDEIVDVKCNEHKNEIKSYMYIDDFNAIELSVLKMLLRIIRQAGLQ